MQQPDLFTKKVATDKATPMIEQFLKIKRQYPETILFYRMGDFYEMFFDDALRASEILNITLTQRGEHQGKPIPMCGVPFHSADNYLKKLISNGVQVTICEQTETPQEAKKRGSKALVERSAVRMVTAGTLLDDELLESDQANRLACFAVIRNEYALAWIEISNGELYTQSIQPEQLNSLLSEIEPSEIIIEETLSKNHELVLKQALLIKETQISCAPRKAFSHTACIAELNKLFGEGRYENLTPSEEVAAAVMIGYIKRTQIGKLPNIKPPKSRKIAGKLIIDAATRRNLELSRTLNGERKGSLLFTLNRCVSPAGKRLFADYLQSPLTDLVELNIRQDKVESFIQQTETRQEIREVLRNLPDLQRPLSRLSLSQSAPKDLLTIKIALKKIFKLQNFILESSLNSILESQWKTLRLPSALLQILEQAIYGDLPKRLSDGGVIKDGFDEILDHQRLVRNDSQRLIMQLQQRLQVETQLKSLKIKFNNMLGYFIEVSDSSSVKLAPEQFIHRQSLKNISRFTTTELIDLGRDIQLAADRALEREGELYHELCEKVRKEHTILNQAAQITAELDVFSALGHLALEEHYTRPTLHPDTCFCIKGGRHPVVEKTIREMPYAANDCVLEDQQRLWLLSGPNMAGKSTFLRQNALIVIMAQIGSYVPADCADIGIVDQVFSRVGAADDLARGHSTFMVEMIECAAILHRATERSFVILDEIGRGTATYDGLSIAWACVEFLHDQNRARTLFATHYHELSDALEEKLNHLSSFHMKVKKWQEDIIFLYEVASGRAEGSYGVHVAKLAGLPPVVVKSAQNILHTLENKDINFDIPDYSSQKTTEISVEAQSVLTQLENVDVDALSPREALDLLYQMKQQLQTNAGQG